MKRVLIFGGTGFIGSELVKQLDGKFEMVVVYNTRVPETLVDCGAKFVKADVCEELDIEEDIGNIDIVINLVGQIVPDAEQFRKINIGGNKNIIEFIKKKKVGKTVLISSVLVYGESEGVACDEVRERKPKTNYAKVKAEVEDMYLNSDIEGLTVLRLGNVYGRGQKKGLIHNLLSAYKGDGVIKFPKKNKIRNFINVIDVSNAIELAITAKRGCKIFNIGGSNLAVRDIIGLFEQKSAFRFEKRIVDFDDEDEIVIDTGLAKKELGFEPKQKIEDAIDEIIEEDGKRKDAPE